MESKVLGEGTFGKIYLEEHPKYGLVAIKRVSADKRGKHEINLHEAKILKYLTDSGICKNIIKLYEIEKVGKKVEMIMEYFDGFVLNDVKIDWKEDDAFGRWSLIKDELIQTVACLHQNHVVHRDIKLENCMFNEKEFKLIDFGFACRIDDLATARVCQHVFGTPSYLSPELVSIYRPRPNRKKLVLTWDVLVAGDVWAIGQTLFSFAYRTSMYAGSNMMQTFDNIDIMTAERGMKYFLEQWKDPLPPPEVNDIILALLDPDPEVRVNNFKSLQ